MANGQQGAVQGIGRQIDCKVNNEKKKKEEVAGDVATVMGVRTPLLASALSLGTTTGYLCFKIEPLFAIVLVPLRLSRPHYRRTQW